MSLKLGNTTIAGISRETKLNAHSLLDFKWTDHILNEMSWLRADTFSWQSGDVYTSVYNLLVSEYQNGTEETEGNITFKRSPNGYKITTDESGVSALFNETGVAWYYILDTENRRFKLPRSKYNAYASQIAVKGNGLTLGLTDGTQDVGIGINSSSYTWTFGGRVNLSGKQIGESMTGNNPSGGKVIGVTTDPTKSGLIADLPTQDLHLYFYVGEFSQTATEQTAGITAELFNNKADTTLSNINVSASAKEMIVGWGLPDYSAGVSVSFPFVAPTNGILQARAATNNTNNIIKIDGNEVMSAFIASNYGQATLQRILISKNEKAEVTAGSFNYAVFYPFKGVN